MTIRQYVILLGGTVVAALTVSLPAVTQAQDPRDQIEAIVKDYIASHPDEVGEIVKDYFIRHPDAVGQMLASVLKHRASPSAGIAGSAPAKAAPAVDRSAAVAANAQLLFASPHQVDLGDAHGDVALVEFFDYNCGFCRRALPDLLTLLKDDPKLKVVLKEFPILGPGSVDAARVAIAVRMQDPEKYLAFHKSLLANPGPVNKERALAAAKDQGLDIARIEADMTSAEVSQTLNESIKLAGALGISGTPGYVIDKDVVVGAVGLAGLQSHIETARAQPPSEERGGGPAR
ncbi:MAG: DsbA family protein [Alphaproteobacteria bacterium]|nr:DsbA family protein [Alphaproteobacteria bacterium]